MRGKKNQDYIGNLKINEKIIDQDHEKAEAFKQRLQNIFRAENDDFNEKFKTKVISDNKKYFETHKNYNFKKVNTSDFTNILNKLNHKESEDEFGISNKILKNLPYTTIQQITNICNKSIETHEIPTILKNAKVTMIPKPNGNNKNDIKN